MILMVFGEIGNFLAYGFAPATLVAPLGAVSVVSNSIMAHFLLHEHMTRRSVTGILVALAGSSAIVVSAPTVPPPPLPYAVTSPPQSCDTQELNPDDIIQKLKWPGAIAFISVIVLSLAVLFAVKRDIKKRHLVLWVLQCALLGAITVICTKGAERSQTKAHPEGVSTAVRSLTAGNPSFLKSPITYIFILCMAGSIVLQLRFLNEAMIVFRASDVIPVYYVLFTLSSILVTPRPFPCPLLTSQCGIFVYREIHMDQPWRFAVFPLGSALAALPYDASVASFASSACFSSPASPRLKTVRSRCV
jgi:magnesium transporter